MPLETGKCLGPYQIVGPLGKGGMGEVFRAKDTRLGRPVAIKVLCAELAGDATSLARFEREAKALAALSHPNIVVIYDVGTEGGAPFVAMELLEGETLRDCLYRSRLPWRRALEIGRAIADALAAAHSKGVTHRDLKPANVFLTSAGVVKLLDFGLAHIQEPVANEDASSSPTGTVTESGIIMGSVHYLSPEQARGRSGDSRSDLWAFGCVLFEMLAGRRAFEGETPSDTIANLLLGEPQWSEFPKDAPPRVLELIRSCLQKEPGRRADDALALKVELESVSSGATISSSVTSVSRSRPRSRVAKKRIKSLAVLPLANLSGDPEKEYFADGMTEAVISALARLGTLRIISRTSAMRYKGTKKSVPEIAEELNVDAVLEGSVLPVARRVRISVQLISAATDSHLWAESYERDMEDVLSLQSEVADAVSQKIVAAATHQDAKATARRVDPESYEAYLKGRYQVWKYGREHMDTALSYYRLALEKDPKSAVAYAGIGDAWLHWSMRGYVPSSEALPRSKDALERAREIDSSLVEVHVALANILWTFEWDWSAAEKEFQTAIRMNGNCSEAHVFYSDLLASTGRPSEGLEMIQRALELDPLNSFVQCMRSWQLVYVGRSDEAITELRKTLRSEPRLSMARMGLWGAFYQKRMYEEALEEAKAFFTILGDGDVAEALTGGGGEAGYRAAMRSAAERLMERSRQAHIPAIRIARLYAHAGAKDEAVEWLDRAHEQRELPLIHVNVGWDWDGLHDHPGFRDLIARMKFPGA